MSCFYAHTYQARSSSEMQPRTDSSPQRKCVRRKVTEEDPVVKEGWRGVVVGEDRGQPDKMYSPTK